MTDYILKSNTQSVILKSEAAQKVVDLSYDHKPSFPILAKQCKGYTSTNVNIPSGGEIIFPINKAMLLRDMMVVSSFKTATAGIAVGTPIGLNLYERVDIRSGNKVIMSLSDHYILSRTQQSGEARQNAIYRRCLPLVVTTQIPITSTAADTVYDTYTPLFSSFFENVSMAFDLNFYENLSLVCKVNSAARGGFPGVITVTTASLYIWTYRLEDKAYNELRARNQSPQAPLSVLAYNTYHESEVCTSTTSNTMRINVNYPVFNTYIMIKGTTAAALAKQVKINSFDFSVGGDKLLDNVPYLVGNWESCSVGGASSLQTTSITATTYDDSKCICINWGMEPWNRVSNTGAVSFAEINYPSVTVYTSTGAMDATTSGTVPADYSIVLVHEYWNVLTLDAANGSVGITINS